WRLARDVANRDREGERRVVLVTHGKAAVAADEQARPSDLPSERQVLPEEPTTDRPPVDHQGHRTATRGRAHPLEADGVLAGSHRPLRRDSRELTEEVEHRNRSTGEQIEG